jgi:LacI family transcriptional regulator
MQPRVTIADVAERVGVHKGTVSRALNKVTQHQVNPATAKRIQRAARELGYVPNIVARGLRTSHSMTIGIILPDLTNPLFPPIVRGVESYLSPRDYTALIVNTDGRDDKEAEAFDSLLERRVDGFLIATGQVEHQRVNEMYNRGIRAVMLNRGSSVPYPLVTGDDAAGVTASVDHLVGLGHRYIAHLAGPSNLTTTAVRSQAFITAAGRHPGVRHVISPAPALSVSAGETGMNQLLEKGGDLPTAIITGNDLMAIGVLRSLRAHGLECPRDISVIGFNDMPFAEDLNPPLTTVRVPHIEMGSAAARLLLEGIAGGPQQHVTLTLPASLVVRRSTAAPRDHELIR